VHEFLLRSVTVRENVSGYLIPSLRAHFVRFVTGFKPLIRNPLPASVLHAVSRKHLYVNKCR
jgi:hypothetical protein